MTRQFTTLILLLALVAAACAGSAAETPASSTADTPTTTTQPPETTTTTTSTLAETTTTANSEEGDPDALAWAYLPTDPETGYPTPDLRGDDIPQIIRDTWAYSFWQISDPAAAYEVLDAGRDITYHPECECYAEDLEGFRKLADDGVRYLATASDYDLLHINLLGGSVDENAVSLYVVASWKDLEQVDSKGNPVPDGATYPGVANWRPGNPGSAYFAVILKRVSVDAPWQHRTDRLEGFLPQDYEGPLAGFEILLDGGKITIG